MTDGTIKSTFDGMRALTSQIDPSVEAMLDAHNFVFTRMNATHDHVCALFTGPQTTDSPPWQLSVRHSINGERMILLSAQEEQPQLSLSILIGTSIAQTLAEAVGLAVSFVSLSEQIKATP
ncbi:MAG TPA: hypothetical protein VN809_10235 [Telmatospirillum sp.]|nr:hypothetical protein [Telmatospirillum sp.]